MPGKQQEKCRMAEIKGKHAQAAGKETRIFRALRRRLLMDRLEELIKRHCQGCGLKPRRSSQHTHTDTHVRRRTFHTSQCVCIHLLDIYMYMQRGTLIYPRANQEQSRARNLSNILTP